MSLFYFVCLPSTACTYFGPTPKLFFFFLLLLYFFFNFMTKLAVFSHQNLMTAVNSYSLTCKITLTIPQSLHIVYDITVDRTPGRFSSHHCRNRWSIEQLKKTLPPIPIFIFVWRANNFFCLIISRL